MRDTEKTGEFKHLMPFRILENNLELAGRIVESGCRMSLNLLGAAGKAGDQAIKSVLIPPEGNYTAAFTGTPDATPKTDAPARTVSAVTETAGAATATTVSTLVADGQEDARKQAMASRTAALAKAIPDEMKLDDTAEKAAAAKTDAKPATPPKAPAEKAQTAKVDAAPSSMAGTPAPKTAAAKAPAAKKTSYKPSVSAAKAGGKAS